MFDDFFGGMFDFDGNGETNFLEQATGFAVLNELSEDEETDDLLNDSDDFDY